MTYAIVSTSTTEPVSLIEAASNCRIDPEDRGADDLLAYITAARSLVEVHTNRFIVPTTVRLSLDRFPGSYFQAWQLTHRYEWDAVQSVRHDTAQNHRTIFLPGPPLVAVSSVTYVNQAGAPTTLDPSLYIVDADSEPGRLTSAYNTDWPATRDQVNAVLVTYTAGYATPDTTPGPLKQAIKMLASYWFNNREAAGASMDEQPLAFRTLIAAYAVPSVH